MTAPNASGGQTTGSAEAVLGTAGPDAKILAFASAATGAPVSLDELVDSVDVLTLVARGPDERGLGASEVRLELHGAKDTTLVLRLERPAPSIVAHAFRLHGAARVDGARLAAGHYEMRVALGANDGRTIAASAPLYFTVSAGAR
jgi:hypothetical protein